MERISALNKQQAIRELQSYKEYKNQSQKDIGKLFDGVQDVRSKLFQLEQQKMIPLQEETIIIDHQSYTIDALRTMIAYYNEHVIRPSLIPPLNDDMMKEIMLNASTATIKNLCLTNKAAKKYCYSNAFWLEKFRHDMLPLPIIPNENKKIAGKNNIPKNMKLDPQIPHDWIEALHRMTVMQDAATRLVNYIVSIAGPENRIFNEFSLEDARRNLWLLPTNIYKLMKHDCYYTMHFHISTPTDITMEIVGQECDEEGNDDSDEEDNISEVYKSKITRQQFIHFLTLLFYYNDDEENEFFGDDEGNYININNLISNKRPVKDIIYEYI